MPPAASAANPAIGAAVNHAAAAPSAETELTAALALEAIELAADATLDVAEASAAVVAALDVDVDVAGEEPEPTDEAWVSGISVPAVQDVGPPAATWMCGSPWQQMNCEIGKG
jgi:hypothetical protein